MRSVAIVAGILLLAAFGACSQKPDEPNFDNPFDPDGTDPGTGYDLRVVASGKNVVMTWDNLPGVYSYEVFWSDSSDDIDLMQSISDSVIPPATGPSVQFIHQDFTAERTNWYRIQAYEGIPTGDPDFPFEKGNPYIPSVAVALDVDLLLAPTNGQTFTPTRFVQLDILTGVADTVEISNEQDFAVSTLFPVTPGVESTVPWTLSTTTVEGGTSRPVENLDVLPIYYRTRGAGSTGPTRILEIEVRFSPALSVARGLRSAPGGIYMVDTLQVTTLSPIAGQSLVSVERYRKTSPTSTSYEFVEDITPPSLADSIKVHWDPVVEVAIDNRIAAETMSDFGFTGTAILDLKMPVDLADPVMEVVGGLHTTTRDIQIYSEARNAGYLIVSENADFAGSMWVTWTDTLDYQLKDVSGTRFLYAAYSNPILAETKVTSALVSLVLPPAPARP